MDSVVGQNWSQLMLYLYPAGQILGVLLAVVVVFEKTNRRANWLLAGIILGVTYHQFLWHDFWRHPDLRTVGTFRSGFPVALLLGPLLYFYVRRVSGAGLPPRYYLHLIPVFVAAIWMVVIRSVPVTRGDMFVRLSLVVLSFSLYLASAIPYMRDFQSRRIKECLSDVARAQALWLVLVYALLCTLLVVACFEFLMIPRWGVLGLTTAAATVANILLTLFALRMSPIFSLVERQTVISSEGVLRFFSPEELKQRKEQLKNVMACEKVYLKSDLTLADLAEAMRLKPYQLTEIINRGFGQSFFEFVNAYRVNAVKQNLVDPNFSHMSVLGVALDSGFSSKSSFNQIFRKVTGKTPSQYREETKGNKDVQVS